MLALMQAHDTAAWGGSDWTRADLEEYWDELDLERDAWVVELDGRLAGYVDFEARPAGRLIADGYVDPEARGRGVGSALADTVEARAASELGAHGRPRLPAVRRPARRAGRRRASFAAGATTRCATSGAW